MGVTLLRLPRGAPCLTHNRCQATFPREHGIAPGQRPQVCPDGPPAACPAAGPLSGHAQRASPGAGGRRGMAAAAAAPAAWCRAESLRAGRRRGGGMAGRGGPAADSRR